MRERLLPVLFLLSACTVLTAEPTPEEQVPFACQADTDCEVGHCLTEFGICTRSNGQLTRVLFEITPQASDPVYGGARFLTVQDVRSVPTEAPEVRGIAPGWLELNVLPQVGVTGTVSASPDQAACLSRARSTLPVSLTFTPRERLLGLSVPAYELSTSFDAAVGEYRFEGSLPPGRYDVYMRPDSAALPKDCQATPQIFRDRLIGKTFDLAQPPPSSLRLTIPWEPNLEGWMLDMVHPVTGEVLSNRVLLHAADVDTVDHNLRTTLHYASAPDNDYIPDTGEELVRLTPPADSPAGTVLLLRSGLELVAKGEGVIGNVSTFGTPVNFHAWVWQRDEDEFDKPVRASVNFAALELDQLAEGVRASFDRSATVDELGQVHLLLLPGRYRVRVTPPLVQPGLLAGFESTLTVWPTETTPGFELVGTGSIATKPPPQQGGHLIEVPAAAWLRGQVTAEGVTHPLAGVEVRATAAGTERSECTAETENETTVPCNPPGRAVVRKLLAQDPFVPRTRGTLSAEGGAFEIDGLDCGQCQPGAGARFDLTARPAPRTGLPWAVRRSVDVYANQLVAPLRIPVPVAQPMQLTYGDPIRDPGPNADDPADDRFIPQGLPGALVRVFIYMDDRGRVVTGSDLDDLVPCLTVQHPDGKRCTQSLLQIAEVRSGPDGEFLLLLPPSIE